MPLDHRTTLDLPAPVRARRRVRLLVHSFVVLLLVELTARRAPVTALCARFGVEFAGFTPPPGGPRPLPRDILDQWWSVETSLRWWPWARHRTCLRRSLVLGHHLRHLQPALCLEITSTSPFAAHAWLLARGHRLDMGDGGPLVTAVERP